MVPDGVGGLVLIAVNGLGGVVWNEVTCAIGGD